MIFSRHPLLLGPALLHSVVGRPDPVASTTTLRSGPAFNRTQPITNGSCQPSCVYTLASLTYNWWDPVSITETVTAETVVTVINRKKNTTSLSTKSNPSWDPSKHPKPTELNSDGTRTALIAQMAPSGSSMTTYTLTFPTMYIEYPPTYTVRGQIPTTIDGKSTCATFTGGDEGHGETFTWPSHPTIAPTAPILDADRFRQDPRGWSWVFKDQDAFAEDVFSNASLPEADRHPGVWWVKPFFPSLPMWDCSAGAEDKNPYAMAAKTALFLTGSSTAFEDGDDDDDDDKKRTSGPGSPASAIATTPTAPVSVTAASNLLPSPTGQAPGAKTSPSPTPANTASDQLPLPTSQASQTAPGSSMVAIDNSLPVLSADVKAQFTHTESIKAGGSAFAATTAASANAQLIPASSRSQVLSGDIPAVSSPSPNTIESVLATPLVLLPGSQSVVLSLSGSETTLAIQTSGPPQSFQFASQAIAVDSDGQYRVDSLTLSPNQAVTVVQAPADVDQDSGSMTQHPNTGGSGESSPAPTTAPPALVVGSQTIQPNGKGNYVLQSETFTADAAGRLIVGGQTLAPGSAITVSGTPISLSPQKTGAIGGTSEQTGLGPAIMGGLGPGAPSSSNSANVSGTGGGSPVPPVAFTGAASRVRRVMLCELATLGLVMLGIVHMV